MGSADKKIKFYVATNWQRDLIPNIQHRDIEEIYGKLNADFVGGAKPSGIGTFIAKRLARQHIQQAHKHGLKFNYLLNGVCLDNQESTRCGQRKIHSLLDWVANTGADSVTVSIPYLLQLIKKQYPHFKVYVSIYAGVDSIGKAEYWENLGADLITLSSRIVREFPLLKEIRRNTRCKLQLIGNIACLYDCPLIFYHKNLFSHASQRGHTSAGAFIDYCHLNCSYRKVSNPLELIRASWIRPEDVCYYEDAGIDRIKLVDVDSSAGSMISVINAYALRKYEGNLIDLLFTGFFPKNPLHIDNKALDGFLAYFLKESCYLKSCPECGYCQRTATAVVKADAEQREKNLSRCNNVLEGLITGKLFK